MGDTVIIPIVFFAFIFILLLIWAAKKVYKIIKTDKSKSFFRRIIKVFPLTFGIISILIGLKFYTYSDIDDEGMLFFAFWMFIGVPLTWMGIKIFKKSLNSEVKNQLSDEEIFTNKKESRDALKDALKIAIQDTREAYAEGNTEGVEKSRVRIRMLMAMVQEAQKELNTLQDLEKTS